MKSIKRDTFLAALFMLSLIPCLILGADSKKATKVADKAQVIPDSTLEQREMVRTIIDRFKFLIGTGPAVGVRADGVTSGLIGDGLNVGITASDPLGKAQQFIELNKDLFQMQDPVKELSLDGAISPQQVPGHIEFHQVVNGIPVDRAIFIVWINHAGRISEVTSGYEPQARKVDTTPSISEDQAREIALQNAPPFPQDTALYRYFMSEVRNVGLIIGKVDGEFHLAWRVYIPRVDTVVPAAIYWVDAKTGQLLKKEDTERQ